MAEPWTEDQARWVLRRAATLAMAGAEPVGPTVLPDARFFPDRFDRTPRAVAKLFERMRGHVGLDDLDVALVLIDADGAPVASSCGSGACGSGGAVKTLAGSRVERRGEGYAVAVAAEEIAHPVVLTTVMARALGTVFLDASGAGSRLRKEEAGRASDLAASMLGLGVLVANGAGIEVKGCGGVKVHAATALSAPEAALALAICLERTALRSGDGRSDGHRSDDAARVVAGLDPVARDLFGPAMAFARANRALLRRIDLAPEAVEGGDFRLESGLSLGTRILRKLGVGRGPEDVVEALEREASSARLRAGPRLDPEKKAKLAELGALYDEATGDPSRS
jgi:hypothetical protein